MLQPVSWKRTSTAITRTYPGRADDSRAPTMAWKLFDLATTQRAMLPAVRPRTRAGWRRHPQRNDWPGPAEKLTGMRLHHFGGFYRSWRANDWMVKGQLDERDGSSVLLVRRVRWIVGERAGSAGAERCTMVPRAKLKEQGT